MEVWTGVACLVADPKCEGLRRFGEDGKGAYVHRVASVNSEAEFTERVERIAAYSESCKQHPPILRCARHDIAPRSLTGAHGRPLRQNPVRYRPGHSSTTTPRSPSFLITASTFRRTFGRSLALACGDSATATTRP